MRGLHATQPALRRPLITFILAASLVVAGVAVAHANGSGTVPGHVHDHASRAGPLSGATQRDLAQVRAAVAQYRTPDRASAAGWDLLPDLDHCFEHPEAGGMGVHYIDEEQLTSGTLDPLRPEALVFVPGPKGQLRLGAVEYIVPVELWDEPAPPSVLGHDLHQLEPVPGVHVWGLHVWLFEPNPAGMFADWNPRVSC